MMRTFAVKEKLWKTVSWASRRLLQMRRTGDISNNRIRWVVLFLTNRCNARCCHCFYAKQLGVNRDCLRYDEFIKMIDRMPELRYLVLTGGEPFLNADMVPICRHLIESGVCRNIQINTNGLLSERIYDYCRDILKSCAIYKLRLQLSIEGAGETHDKIVGVPNASQAMSQTLDIVGRLKSEFSNFDAFACVTLMKQNRGDYANIFRWLAPYGLEIKFAAYKNPGQDIRDLAAQPADFDMPDTDCQLDWPELERIRAELSDIDKAYNRWCITDRHRMDVLIQMLKVARQPFPCVVKHTHPVIFENGDVSLCEWTRPVGNLSQSDYDLQAVWHGRQADEQRAKMNKCWCTQGAYLLRGLEYGLIPGEPL
jgi:MoaA/NifB/PqqE/SkfB family radical SAM enzyme